MTLELKGWGLNGLMTLIGPKETDDIHPYRSTNDTAAQKRDETRLFNWLSAAVNLTIKCLGRWGPTDCNNLPSSHWCSLCVCVWAHYVHFKVSACVCMHTWVTDWQGECNQSILPVWLYAPLWSPYHQPTLASPSDGRAAINSWLGRADGESHDGHYGAHHHHQAACIHPSGPYAYKGLMDMDWQSFHQSQLPDLALHYVFLWCFILSVFKTCTVATEVKHEIWKGEIIDKSPAG